MHVKQDPADVTRRVGLDACALVFRWFGLTSLCYIGSDTLLIAITIPSTDRPKHHARFQEHRKRWMAPVVGPEDQQRQPEESCAPCPSPAMYGI